MQKPLGRVIRKCRGRKDICFSEKEKEDSESQRVVGDEARDLGLTKVQVTEIVDKARSYTE